MNNEERRVMEFIGVIAVVRQALLRSIRRMEMDCPMVWEIKDCEGALISIDRILHKIKNANQHQIEPKKDAPSYISVQKD